MSKDTLLAVVMIIALIAVVVLLFNINVGLDTRTFGLIAFGAILVFGVVNLIIALTGNNRD
ncbi:hypothetical protein [Roseibium sp. RKSG952]|uniref:hypothetical protein n=1 Tax=Roseibium sp. RKSG952 TaxID=2529384 RepID=UPI0012BD6131|nr:hypothetical protein [Roseibium sp. RKSG952]MTH96939.1 hypothetical protein [Roseibium sp. RKSG952]